MIVSGVAGASFALGSCGPRVFDTEEEGATGDDDDNFVDPSPTAAPENACTGVPDLPGAVTPLTTADIPVGQVRYVASMSMFICHDSSGFYAMTSLCTAHGNNMGTQTGWNPSNLSLGFTCTHQNSRFGPNGNVTQSPATIALAHKALGVSADDGRIWVDVNSTVPANTRCNPT